MIDFTLDETQEMLRSSVERFAERHDRLKARRDLSTAGTGGLPDAWLALAAQGLLGMTAPERYGGWEGGPLETLIVMEALGRRLLGEPFLTSGVMAAALLAASRDPRSQDRLFPQLVNGELRLSVACCEPRSGFDLASIQTRAERGRDGFLLSGNKSIVLHSDEANAIVVPARTAGPDSSEEGLTLFIVRPGTAGLALAHHPTIDAHRAAELSMDRVEVPFEDVLGTVGKGFLPLEHAVDTAIAASCAEAVGIMSAMLDDTVAFLKTRKQFGRPIAEFQALQHRVADMRICLEQTRSAAAMAAVGVGAQSRSERRRAISAAKVLVGRHARSISHEAVQLHGAIGTTDELAIGHYFKRLHAIDISWGGRRQHLAAYTVLMDA